MSREESPREQDPALDDKKTGTNKHSLEGPSEDAGHQLKKRHIDSTVGDGDNVMEFADDEQLRFLAEHLESVDDDDVDNNNGSSTGPIDTHKEPASLQVKPPNVQVTQEKQHVDEDETQDDDDHHQQQQLQQQYQPQQPQQKSRTQSPVATTPSALSETSTNTPVNQVGTPNNEPLGSATTSSDIDYNDPQTLLHLNSLPILDNLASQILTILAKGGPQDTLLKAVVEPESKEGLAFREMLNIFQQVKKIYTKEPFLATPELEFLNTSKKHKAVVQRVNLATFVCAIFGSTQIGFFHLNKYFIDAFVGDNGRLLKSQGALYLELKTQAYISAMKQDQDSSPLNETLVELFPDDIDKVLLLRRPRSRSLAPSEIDFANRCKKRRENLELSSSTAEQLSEKYDWLNFVRDLHDYISKNITHLVNESSLRCDHQESGINGNGKPPIADNKPSYHIWQSQVPTRKRSDSKIFSSKKSTGSGYEAENIYDPKLMSTATGNKNGNDNSTVATAYQSVRSSQSAASANGGTRTGAQYFRRPWTRDEEAALMHGLDNVQGPHWSQILELHGAGGTISEVLKDRTQVQLKDKARNLKLFFIKGGHEIPPVLKYVTGDSRRGKKKTTAAKPPVTATTESSPRPTTTNTSSSPVTNIPSNTAASSSTVPQSSDSTNDEPKEAVQSVSVPSLDDSSTARNEPATIDPELKTQNQPQESQLESGGAADNDKSNPDHETTNIEELLQSVGDFINSRSNEDHQADDSSSQDKNNDSNDP